MGEVPMGRTYGRLYSITSTSQAQQSIASKRHNRNTTELLCSVFTLNSSLMG
ncbi:unnamed protein product, partial [Nesidiocoris tenuis]